jgi:alpha-L-arabinofuranosidase
MIAELKPGYVKFPGGFATEGRGLASRYNWKDTIGDAAERRPAVSPWAGYSRRPDPEHYDSFGMGFFEFFQFCEDLGAEPPPVLNPVMGATFTGETAPLDELGSWIQDALDRA